MAASTLAMKWYGGQQQARHKYLFEVIIRSAQYPSLQTAAKDLYKRVRTIELPKYSIETEVINAWNVRQLVPTRVNFEPVSITFNDTTDNTVRNFVQLYMSLLTGSFTPLNQSVRTGFDGKGIKLLETNKDCLIDTVDIICYPRYLNATDLTATKIQLHRPKIIDVQHDTMDYATSDPVTWTISLRYESVTYEDIQPNSRELSNVLRNQ